MQKLVDEIRQIYASDHLQAEAGIERYLNARLRSFPLNKKIALLEKLTEKFGGSPANDAGDATVEDEVLSRLFSLVLGGKAATADLSSAELLQRLAESLNTIFDRLNQLVNLINTTFPDQSAGEGTIRQAIGYHLEGEDQLKSLESYLGQINHAFLLTQQAYKKAARKTVSTILFELDPERIAEKTESGLKIGPLRKAELFEVYKNKHKTCRNWYESGRFMENFLKEFEKICQQKTI